MGHTSTEHEVLAVVFQVGDVDLRQTRPSTCCYGSAPCNPNAASGRCPAGRLRADEDLTSSVRRQLAEKVDLREIAHLEQLAVFSDPHRVPGARTIASTFLGLVPSPATPNFRRTPAGTRSNALPPMAFDHGPMVAYAQARLVAKLSYTNIGFALAPKEFALSTLRDIYGAALGLPGRRHQPAAGAGPARGHHPRPGPPPTPVAAAAGRPPCTASPTPGCGSPTSSPRCGRPGESTGFLDPS